MKINGLNTIFQYTSGPERDIDILVVAAHPDDAELGCGGVLLKARDAGLKTAVVDLTDGEPTPFGSKSTRIKEAELAAQRFGLTARLILPFKNRFLQDTIEARIEVAKVYRIFRPKVVLTHFPEDAHPDHIAASHIARAARFYAKLTKTDWAGEPYYPPRLYYFYALHLKRSANPSFLVPLSRELFDEKMENLKDAYKSQLVYNKNNAAKIEQAISWWANWGLFAGAPYAEPFYAEEEIIIDDLRVLL